MDYPVGQINQLLPAHSHNGIDSPRIMGKDVLGFPVKSVADATVKPNDAAQEGIFRFYFDGTHIRLWARINKDWHYIALT